MCVGVYVCFLLNAVLEFHPFFKKKKKNQEFKCEINPLSFFLLVKNFSSANETDFSC